MEKTEVSICNILPWG